MKSSPLLILDFDGVIVDGLYEYWQSSRKACLKLLGENSLYFSLPEAVPEVFRQMRPWVNHGWEMVLLAAECSKKTSQLNLKGVQNFSKNYSTECSLALNTWGWTPSQLQEALNHTRRVAISHDFNPSFIFVNAFTPSLFTEVGIKVFGATTFTSAPSILSK